jgi:glycosyltransferase involved in cell wall biosynthesis
MSQPLVSVIMNCFNGQAFLRQAIDSVIAQTYDNWEIVFWDNQSTDSSAAIVRSYSDPRIRYLYAPSHTTLYEARNHAIVQARGEFIALLDVDDWWQPNKLALQVPLFSDPKVGVVAGNYYVEKEFRSARAVANSAPVPAGWVLDDLLRAYYVCSVSIVVRRTALDTLEYVCDPRYSIIGDFDLVIRLATRWKLGYVQDPIAHYRLHAGSLTSKSRGRYVQELEMWLGEIGSREPVRSSEGLAGFRAELEYTKALNAVLEGHRWRGLRMVPRLASRRFQAAVVAAAVLPRPVFHWLKN